MYIYIYLYIYIYIYSKIVTKTLMGLKIWYQVGGRVYGWDGWDGISKVSFKFLYTLWVYRTFTYVRLYIVKNFHQDSYWFKNLISSWGSWSKISKLQQVGDVIDFRSKSLLFIFTVTWESCLYEKLKKDELLRGSTQITYFLSKHLQGPFGVQDRSKCEAQRAELRMDGMEYQKCPSIFFILLGV